MKFSSAMIKNIKYNMKNYAAYLFGNSIILSILFMFFTLMFSDEFMQQKGVNDILANYVSVIVLMSAFSVVYIIFTTISFTKYRGKEFGVYFTIGLTSKEIMKILCFEDLLIAGVSFIISIITGSIFSKLFHMAIFKILDIPDIHIPISFKSYGLILLFSCIIFIFTLAYQFYFLWRHSVLDILKSKVKKDIGRTGKILGFIGIAGLIAAIMLFNKALKFDTDNWNNGDLLIAAFICFVISLYLAIGFSLTLLCKCLKRFKTVYNGNILFINSIAHRFTAYKTVLYVVTIAVACAVIFIAASYGIYKETESRINLQNKYDMTFILDKNTYEKSKEEIENVADIKEFNAVEGVNAIKCLVNSSDEIFAVSAGKQLIISEESNNRLPDKPTLNLNDGELLQYQINKEDVHPYAGILLDYSGKNGSNLSKDLSSYMEKTEINKYIYKSTDDIKAYDSIFSNYNVDNHYSRIEVYVVSNNDYDLIKKNTEDKYISYDILCTLKDPQSADKEEIQDKIRQEFGDNAADTLTVKSERFRSSIKENGFMLFTFCFVGGMFLVGSGAVLYFKTITLEDEDRERSKQLIKLGLTKKHIYRLIEKELGIIFFIPPIIALTGSAYILSKICDLVPNGDIILKYSWYVFGIYAFIQIIFYIITCKKHKMSLKI